MLYNEGIVFISHSHTRHTSAHIEKGPGGDKGMVAGHECALGDRAHVEIPSPSPLRLCKLLRDEAKLEGE